MLYTILKDERIVIGPKDWNAKYFEYFLRNECDVETSLDAPISEPRVFNESTKLVPTFEEPLPESDANFEQITGPRFKYDDEGNHIVYYVNEQLPIETIKGNLLKIVANNRWVKETTPITRNISGNNITINTDAASRTSYTQALVFANDDYAAQWKFPEGFFLLNKTDLQSMVSEVVAYVQYCFDWEAQKATEINSKQTIEELRLIALE